MDMPNQFSIFPPGGLTPPKGLNVVMEGLVREVLLKNPKNIYGFASEYFEKLIEIRKNANFGDNKEISNLVYLHQNYKEETVTKQRDIDEFDKLLSSSSPENIVVESVENHSKSDNLNIDIQEHLPSEYKEIEQEIVPPEENKEIMIDEIKDVVNEKDENISGIDKDGFENQICNKSDKDENHEVSESSQPIEEKNHEEENRSSDHTHDIPTLPTAEIATIETDNNDAAEINTSLSSPESNKSIDENVEDNNNITHESTEAPPTDTVLQENHTSQETSGEIQKEEENVDNDLKTDLAIETKEIIESTSIPLSEEIPSEENTSAKLDDDSTNDVNDGNQTHSTPQPAIENNDLQDSGVDNAETDSNRSYSDKNNGENISQAETIEADYEMKVSVRSIENLYEHSDENENKNETPHIKSVEGNDNKSPPPEAKKDILEKATIVIQKIFRGFLARNKVTQMLKNKKNNEINKRDEQQLGDGSEIAKKAIIANAEPTLYTVPEEKNGSYSTEEESSTFSSAATKIQAGVRGFLTRKFLQQNKTNTSSDTTAPSIGEDSKSLDETFDSNSTDDTVSKIIVATSSIIIEQLEHFEKLESNKNLQSVGSNYDSMETSRDGDERRKRLKREDAIQLHSPYSSGETSANKCSPGKTSEDEEPIGDLAQSIIKDIISSTYSHFDKMAQDNQINNGDTSNDEGKGEYQNAEDIPESDDANEPENLLMATKDSKTFDIDLKNDVETDKENSDTICENEENNQIPTINKIISQESVQSDDGDVIIGTTKLNRPSSNIECEQNENLEMVVEPKDNGDFETKEKYDTEMDEKNNLVVGEISNIQEHESPDVELESESAKVDESETLHLSGDVPEIKSEENESIQKDDAKSIATDTDKNEPPIGLQHSGEFHDPILPTKVVRKSSIQKGVE